MSYILEALKKSEARRRLGSAPDPTQAHPQGGRRPGRWRLGVLGLTAITVGAAVGLWLSSARDPASPPPLETAVSVPAPDSPQPAADPAPAPPDTVRDADRQAPTTAVTWNENTRGDSSENDADLSQPTTADRQAEATSASHEEYTGERASTPDPSAGSAVSDNANTTTPDDPAPATTDSPLDELAADAARRAARRELAAEPEGPTLLEAMPWGFRTQLPPLALNVHVYVTRHSERFVIINMERYAEGEFMEENGIRVVEITPDGVVLEYNGQEFLLQR